MQLLRVAALLSLATAGCGGGPKMYPVSGTVTYDGKPLPAGQISFEADVTKGHDGPQGMAYIKDGRFDTAQQKGKGVLGGPYVIRIQGFDGTPGNELPMGKPLFTDFVRATLERRVARVGDDAYVPELDKREAQSETSEAPHR